MIFSPLAKMGVAHAFERWLVNKFLDVSIWNITETAGIKSKSLMIHGSHS
jgi:hypothetical protein